jgi:DnaK suppressor protein
MCWAAETAVAEINRYRALLAEKLAELESAMQRLDDIAVETSPDAMDDSTFTNARDIAVERLEQMTVLRESVRRALGRIADGRYGICPSCGQVIKPARLAAVPWAEYCCTCQENFEAINHLRNERSRFVRL